MVDLKLNKDVGVNITTNRKNKIDGLLLLSAIPDDSIKSAFLTLNIGEFSINYHMEMKGLIGVKHEASCLKWTKTQL